jgi:Carbohydrate family 9 binding domain-like
MTLILGTDFPADAPGYEVMPVGAPAGPLIDADAPIWAEARVIEWGHERYRTSFRALWDPLALHVRFDAVDGSPWHTMSARDEHIWEEEVVEIFLDADGSGRNYAEVEISPANVVCDLRVDTPWPSLRSLTEWDWEGLTSTVVPLRDAHGAVEGWTAVARLPWAGLGSLYPRRDAGLPPVEGSTCRFNVFRIKRPGGPASPQDGVVLAAWSKPAGPSFHDPAAFRTMTFRK